MRVKRKKILKSSCNIPLKCKISNPSICLKNTLKYNACIALSKMVYLPRLKICGLEMLKEKPMNNTCHLKKPWRFCIQYNQEDSPQQKNSSSLPFQKLYEPVSQMLRKLHSISNPGRANGSFRSSKICLNFAPLLHC